ncbi:MAG: response regulator [Gammaproteobacteria bacterium]|nr:response regulator [Gammaproteobacteria bacterium]MCZ6797272.1 response regulator [Gammaproteobacteria bacterium]
MTTETLLIVDDETRILRALKAVFRSGYRVRTTTNCSEALHILKTEQVNAIISDQRMPEMRGVDLLNRARRISPNTMRLLMTGYSDVSSILDAINQGEVYRYITKPWGQDEIQAVVANAVKISQKLYDVDHAPTYDATTATDYAEKTELLVLDRRQTIYEVVRSQFSESCIVHYSQTIEDTVKIFVRRPVKVVIVNVPRGNSDYLSFLKLIKGQHPSIVTIAVMAESDADQIIDLINQGQIYRYLPVTIPPGRTRICIQSAINYANRLQANPVLAERHRVEKDETPESISQVNRRRIVESMSMLKRRLFSLTSTQPNRL